MRKQRLRRFGVLGVLAAALFVAWLWLTLGTAPTKPGPKVYVRYTKPNGIDAVLTDLRRRGIIKSEGPMRLYIWLNRGPNTLPVGTYLFQPGETAHEILSSLRNTVRQLVRLPETNWAKRNANLLEKAQVTSAHDYLDLVHDPKSFETEANFVGSSPTLEGFLYPDTYDFPPLLGARPVIERQLKAFKQKVWDALRQPKQLYKTLKVASLVELEAGNDEDRPIIAGVIENRLKKNMPLQIDASLLYGIGHWKRLHFKDYTRIKSPYNLYLHKGLPPTPICSPSLKSIQAAMNPSKHDYLFYVALPNGKSLFAKTFSDHKKNIQRRLKALGAETRNG